MEIFSTARLRDFPVLFRTVSQCRQLWQVEKYIVATPGKDVSAVTDGLGDLATVVDEKTIVPNFDLVAFKQRKIPLFPNTFGWYFQQILKMEYARCTLAKEYLIWDADAIPLREINFTDATGKTYLTTAKEFHQPYFYTFNGLLQQTAPSSVSYISQHLYVNSQWMRDMLSEIESIHRVKNWTDALGNVLEGHPAERNLFSEYETYANYILLRHPSEVITRCLKWSRTENPSAWGLPAVFFQRMETEDLDFMGIEASEALFSRLAMRALENSPLDFFKKWAVTYALRQSAAATSLAMPSIKRG